MALEKVASRSTLNQRGQILIEAILFGVFILGIWIIAVSHLSSLKRIYQKQSFSKEVRNEKNNRRHKIKGSSK